MSLQNVFWFCYIFVLMTVWVNSMEPIVIVQGGAGDIPDERTDGKNRGVIKAVKVGYKTLNETNSVLDAVEAAVKSMELDNYFNCGYGSVLTSDNTVEMDASIMEGRNLLSGCVSIVKDIQHPITLARRVMENTAHTFLAGYGAMKLAKDLDFNMLPEGALATDYARDALEEFMENKKHNGKLYARTGLDKSYGEVGTVGAVAIDSQGNIAVATSTGGATGKLPGRIGDTPILGSGTYANNRYGGVSTTGHGETIMKFNLAHDIIQRINYLKEDAQTATKASVTEMTDRLMGTGGAITIDANGKIGIYFSSRKMSWAYRKGKCIHYGIKRDEDISICE